MSADKEVEARSSSVHLKSLTTLTGEQIREVDRALASMGDFGEVRLVKVKGRLRFIQQLESRDLLQMTCSSGG